VEAYRPGTIILIEVRREEEAIQQHSFLISLARVILVIHSIRLLVSHHIPGALH
jgi:hypothetical protein